MFRGFAILSVRVRRLILLWYACLGVWFIRNQTRPTLGVQLIDAIDEGDVATVRDLLSQGVDPNATVFVGGGWGDRADSQRPLIEAIRSQKIACADVLLENGANVELREEQDTSPLEQAVALDQTESAGHLLEHGAKVDARDSHNGTALMQASKPDIAKMLIDWGADVNAKMDDGTTVLMMNIRFPETVRLLLTYHADCKAKNKEGKMALQLAKAEAATEEAATGGALKEDAANFRKTIQLLEAAGAK